MGGRIIQPGLGGPCVPARPPPPTREGFHERIHTMSRPGHRQPGARARRWETEHDAGGTGRDGALVVVGAGPRVRGRGRVLRQPLRPAAGPGLRLVRHREPRDRRRGPAPAPADPAVHPRVHDRVHAARRVRRDVRPVLPGPWFQRVAGLVVLAARPPDARLRVPAAARRRCTRSGGRCSSGCAPARPARSRSGWRSRPDGRRASGRCWRAILAIAATGGTVKGAALLVVYSLGLGVPFLLVGLGADWLVGSLGWVRRHYRAIAAVSGAFLVAVGVLLMTGLSSGSSPRSRASRRGCSAGAMDGCGGAP